MDFYCQTKLFRSKENFVQLVSRIDTQIVRAAVMRRKQCKISSCSVDRKIEKHFSVCLLLFLCVLVAKPTYIVIH